VTEHGIAGKAVEQAVEQAVELIELVAERVFAGQVVVQLAAGQTAEPAALAVAGQLAGQGVEGEPAEQAAGLIFSSPLLINLAHHFCFHVNIRFWHTGF